MKNQIVFMIGLVILLVSGCALAQETSKVLVLQIDTLDSVFQKEALLLTDELVKAIGRIGSYDVFMKDSSELAKAFEEHGRAIPTVLDDSLKNDLGRWWNVHFVVSGTLSKNSEKRYIVKLDLIDVTQGKTVSTIKLTLIDFRHKLLLDRLARLLLWARLQIICNHPPYEALLDNRVLTEEMMDVDYNVWLVEPGKKHVLEVKTKKDNYTTFKEEIILGVAESRVTKITLKNRKGILTVQSRPDADVYLNNEAIGTTTLRKELQAGEYTITLKAGRHIDVTKKVIIFPEDTTVVQEALRVNYSSYRRNGIISAAAALLCIGSGLYATSEANKAYDQYLQTMNANEMRDQRDKAKTFDVVSYISYGAAAGFVIWSVLEWIGFISEHDSSEPMTHLDDNHFLNLSLSNRGFTVTFLLY